MDAGLAGGPIVLAPDPVEEVWSPGDGGATIPGTYGGLPGREGGCTPFSSCSRGHLPPFVLWAFPGLPLGDVHVWVRTSRLRCATHR